jgi:predicted N-acetyltransferase YhbS
MEVTKMLTIRPETSEDHTSVHNIHQLAFHEDFEPNLVEALRKSTDHIAELDNKVVGHIFLVKLSLK